MSLPLLLLQLLLPREHLFPVRYQAGTILFHRDGSKEVIDYLRGKTFPLLAPNSTFTDPKVKEAVDWVMGKEHLALEQLRVTGAEKLLYFKHEERPILFRPDKLVLGRSQPDELNRDYVKLNVAFTLPPGSYATLVIKRLFHFSKDADPGMEAQQELTRVKNAASAAAVAATTPVVARSSAPRVLLPTRLRPVEPPRRGRVEPEAPRNRAEERRSRGPNRVPTSSLPMASPKEPVTAVASVGYLARQRTRKTVREDARAKTPPHPNAVSAAKPRPKTRARAPGKPSAKPDKKR